MRKEIQDLWALAEPYVREAGFDLVEVHSGRESTGWVVRLFIDRLIDGAGRAGAEAGAAPPHEPDVESLAPPTLEDCARVSRDVSVALDVADLIPHAYQLEVSSPGLDRPLRRERDFARFAGRSARVRLVEGVEGRRNFSGTLRGAQGGLVEIECDGRSYQLPVEQVAKANLVPDWEREFHRSAS
jgi:ribosome maturation factor RimP